MPNISPNENLEYGGTYTFTFINSGWRDPGAGTDFGEQGMSAAVANAVPEVSNIRMQYVKGSVLDLIPSRLDVTFDYFGSGQDAATFVGQGIKAALNDYTIGVSWSLTDYNAGNVGQVADPSPLGDGSSSGSCFFGCGGSGTGSSITTTIVIAVLGLVFVAAFAGKIANKF